MKLYEPLPNIAMPVTPELAQRIKNANKEAHALHLAIMPALYVGVKVTDEHGNVSQEGRYKANSFTRNFWNFVGIFFTGTTASSSTHGTGNLSLKSTAGAVSTGVTYNTFKFGGAGNSDTAAASFTGFGIRSTYTSSGIVVGTSSSPEDFDGYAMEAQISNGSGSGQLEHMAPTMGSTSPIYDSTEKNFSNSFSRIFKNNSGATIGVNEVGIIGHSNTTRFLFERTVLPETITIPTGSFLEVTYTLVFTYPEPVA